MRWYFGVILFLIAAVHGDDTECDLTCEEGHISHSYESGKTYIYKYETIQNVGNFLGDGSVTDQTLKIQGEVSLTAGKGSNRCQLSLAILSWTAIFPVLTNLEEMKDLQLDFKEPATFSYINGTVKAVCLPEDDVWKNNIRRSIISLFQTDFAYLNHQIEGESDSKDSIETSLSGKRVVRYEKFSDRSSHLSKIANTNSKIEKLLMLLRAEGVDPTNFPTIIDRLLMETTVEKCSQDFEANVLMKTNCTESLISTSMFIKSEISTHSNLTLDRVVDTNVSLAGNQNVKLLSSTIVFDKDFEKPSKDPKILQNFEQMLQSGLCKQILDTTDSKDLMEYLEIMKKLIKRISKADLERSFDFVVNSLDCGIANSKRQSQFYLMIAVSSPTEDTVEFFVEQILKGNVDKGNLNSFLLNVVTMEFTGARSLKAMQNLILNKDNIPYEVELIDLLLPSSNLAMVYQSSKYSPNSNHPELLDLIRVISSGVTGMNRLVKMEVLRGLRDFSDEQNVETCTKLAKDDFERQKCAFDCDSISLKFAKDLLLNDTVESEARILAYLFYTKCVSKEIFSVLFANLWVSISNQEVKSFIKSHMNALNGIEITTDLESNETPPISEFQRSRTFVDLQEFANANYVDKLEANIIFGTFFVPRLITVEYESVFQDHEFRDFKVEITVSNSEDGTIDILIAVRRYGITLFVKSLSIRPVAILQWLQNKKLIMNDVLRLFASRIPTLLNLIRDRKLEYFRLNQLVGDYSTLPTISGLPFQQSMEVNIFLSLNLTVQKLGHIANIGKPEFGPMELQLAPLIARKYLENTAIILGTNEIIGHQFIGWKQCYGGTTLSLSKALSGNLTFQASFPKDRETNESRYAFKVEKEHFLRKVQLLDGSLKYNTSSPLQYEKSELNTERNLKLLGTIACENIKSQHSEINQCKIRDWIFTISHSLTDHERKSIELKLYPSQPTKDNTFSANAVFLNRDSFGHEIDLHVESPYNDLHLHWNFSNQEDRISAELTTSFDQSEYALEAYLNRPVQPKMEDRYGTNNCVEKAAICRLRPCPICSFKYEFGLTAKTPIDGLETIVPLHGYLDTGFENKSVLLVVESNGIHELLDSKLKVKFEEYELNPTFPTYHSWAGYHYNLSLEAQNNYLGRLGTTTLLQTVTALITSNESKLDRREEFDASLSIEYGTIQNFHTIALKGSGTLLKAIDYPKSDNNNSLIIATSIITSSIRASQFPVFDFDYVVKSTANISSDSSKYPETYKEEVSLSQKLTRVSNALYSIEKHSIGISWDRVWKRLPLADLRRKIFLCRYDELSDASFDIKNRIEVYSDDVLILGSTIDSQRENTIFKSLALRLLVGSGPPEEKIKFNWDYSETHLNVLAQVSIFGVLHKTEQRLLKSVTSNKWKYTGEHIMTPGETYSISGSFKPSKRPLIDFEEFDITIVTKDSNADLFKISYERDDTAADYIKYKVVILEVSTILLEYKAEFPTINPLLPVNINVLLRDLFKTKLVVFRGRELEIFFEIKLIPMFFKCNGTVNVSREKMFLKTIADYKSEKDSYIFGRFESDSNIDMAADLVIQSRTNLSFRDRSSNLTILSSYDIDDTPTPLIYIYFVDLGGEISQVNLTTVFELYNPDNFDKPARELGLSLIVQRPEVEPFLIDYSVKQFLRLKLLRDPEPGEEDIYELAGHNFTFDLHIVHRDNVLYFAPDIDTDLKWDGVLDVLMNYDKIYGRYPGCERCALMKFKDSLIQLQSNFKSEGLPIPEIHLHNQLEINVLPDHEDLKYEGVLQQDESIYQALGTFKRFSKETDRQVFDWDPYSIFSTVNANGTVLRTEEQLWYQLGTKTYGPDEVTVIIRGSHNLTRYFESWHIFEVEILNEIGCGNTVPSAWTDTIKRAIEDDKSTFLLSSSKLFEIKTNRDDNSALANLTILHPNHKLESFISFNRHHSTEADQTDGSDEKRVWNVDLKYVYKISETGGLEMVHVSKLKQNSLLSTNSVINGHVNEIASRIENNIHFDDESKQTSSMKHSTIITKTRDSSVAYSYHYLTATVVGEIEGIAEILHHDYAFIYFGSDKSKQLGTLNGSITITTPAYLPQLLEWTYALKIHPELEDYTHEEKILLLIGKVPEFICTGITGINLNEEQFPFSLDTLTKLTQSKLYCNEYASEEKYPDFRNKDGRFLVKSGFRILSNETKSAMMDFNAMWENNQCVSELNQVENSKNTSQRLDKYCNLLLKPLPTCWVQPDSCDRSKPFIKEDLYTRRMISYWSSAINAVLVCIVKLFFSFFRAV